MLKERNGKSLVHILKELSNFKSLSFFDEWRSIFSCMSMSGGSSVKSHGISHDTLWSVSYFSITKRKAC